ncbi:hypothetical protein ACFFTN_21035 [Aminobacter aganoensis]|uniref:Uncharacterized protein n=1 Tax=Aminobacter aganoensis TaxID=83264 RepID=A0A7X0FCH3_9HYPH|nr:hypothetical protein [Aminobacter aganoensis]MBB6356948.1 hypothetical protein [Aminobacter aganoensis]
MAGITPTKIDLVAQATDTTDRSGSYTFAGLDFGAEFTNRAIIVAALLVNAANAVVNQSAATIGGVAANGQDSGDAGGPGVGGASCGVWAARPSGTSGSVSISFGATAQACAVFVFATGVASVARFAESVGSGGGGGITSDPNFPASDSGTINIPHDGVLIGGVARANTTAPITLTGFHSQREMALDTGHRIAVGWKWNMQAQTAYPIGYTTSAGGVIYGMEAHSFA